MKILLVTFSDNADHQDTLFGLYEALSPSENVTLLAIKTPKVPLKRGDQTWLVDCPKRPGLCKGTFNLPLLTQLIRRIRKEQFDAIYFESLHVWNLPIMALCGKKPHVYQVIHEVIPHAGDRQVRLVDLMNRAVCCLADTIVLRNQTYLKAMHDRYGLPMERIRFLELWRRYPSYTEPTYSGRVLFFGRINPYKGADNLLALVRRCPTILFEVIGSVDVQMEGITEQLMQEPNVTFRNAYVTDDEMRDCFIRADWVVVPYHSASQSGIIIDAYKFSRPVIAFNVGAIHEQVKDGETGYLIPANDLTAFAARLQAACAMDKADYRVFSQRAYNYGRRKYGLEDAVDAFMQMIDS